LNNKLYFVVIKTSFYEWMLVLGGLALVVLSDFELHEVVRVLDAVLGRRPAPLADAHRLGATVQVDERPRAGRVAILGRWRHRGRWRNRLVALVLEFFFIKMGVEIGLR